MAKIQRKQGPQDVNEIAFRVILEAVDGKVSSVSNGDSAVIKNQSSRKGGYARAAKLSPEQRSRIAYLAAQSRWKK